MDRLKIAIYDAVQFHTGDTLTLQVWQDLANELTNIVENAIKDRVDLYYAKLKIGGIPKLNPDYTYFNLNTYNDVVHLSSKFPDGPQKTQFTKQEWAALGITEDHAVFELVE